MDKNFLTVAEFAQLANVTTQAIYKRFKTDLKEYREEIDGKVYIEATALERFRSENSVGNLVGNGLNIVTNQVTNLPVNDTDELAKIKIELNSEKLKNTAIEAQLEANQRLVTNLKEQIQYLQQQLEKRDNEISKLVDNLASHNSAKDKEVSSLTNQLTKLFDQQQQLQLQQQKLLEPILEQKKLSFWEKIFSKK